MKKEDLTNTELLESLNRSFSNIEGKMATKNDLINLTLELKEEIQDLRLDLKSFKKDTDDSVQKQDVDISDINETILHQDKRIEKLEKKVFI